MNHFQLDCQLKKFSYSDDNGILISRISYVAESLNKGDFGTGRFEIVLFLEINDELYRKGIQQHVFC